MYFFVFFVTQGWIGFNPMLERKEDRTPTYNAIAGMSDNLESVVEMFKGNRCIACLFTTAGQFLPSPYKYAVMEQVRCQKIFTTFFDKYVICKPGSRFAVDSVSRTNHMWAMDGIAICTRINVLFN